MGQKIKDWLKVMPSRLIQYHEIDKIEEKGSRIIARALSRYRGRQIAALKHRKEVDESSLLIDLVPISIAASITAHLKGSKRSLLQADNTEHKNPSKYPELILAQVPGGPGKKIKRIIKRPIKNYLKKKVIGETTKIVEEAHPGAIAKASEAIRLFKKGRKLKEKLQYDETLREKAEYSERTGTTEFKGKEYKYRKKLKKRKELEYPRPVTTYKPKGVRPVPSPRLRFKNRRKGAKKIAEQELNRVKNEFQDKVVREKKRLYDELVRQVRGLIWATVKESRKVVDYEELLSRAAGNEPKVELIDKKAAKRAKKKLLHSVASKAEHKLDAKLERFVGETAAEFVKESFNRSWKETWKERIANFNMSDAKIAIIGILKEKGELQSKLKKEGKKALREYIFKPIKQTVEPPIEDLIFGKIRTPGSHRQYRGTYYHIAKTLQELERGQRRRRRLEVAEMIYESINTSAELILFLRKYSIADIFTFIAELGGAIYFPETAKIGGVIKSVNWLGEVARLLNLKEIDEEADTVSVKEYHIERALRLTQELETLRKLFSRYYPQVFTLLNNVSGKINNNLRQVTNNLILEGVHVNEAKKVLAEAFRENKISPKNNQQIETIYRTQTQLAFSAGRFQADQHPAIQEILWGYKYVTVGDNRVRLAHKILDGVTFPKDHPFWKYYWPPNGWNCRCTVISLFEEHDLVLPKEPVKIEPNFLFNAGMIFTEAAANLK